MKLLFSFVLLCASFIADAQVRRIGVLGSSTANGQGVPFDSSWVQKMRFYYRERALIDTVHKIAASTLDCYSGMPTGYVPPPGRNTPNQSYNITRLMTRTPMPTTVIINYPTTNFDTFSDQEILFCLDSIRKYAMSFGAVCYVATTQPHDNFNDAGRARLRYLNDLIKNYFGEYAIDFFSVLNNPVNNKLQSQYVLGDGIHVNSRGQDALFKQVLQKNIFKIDTTSVRRVLIDVGGVTATTTDQWSKRWNHMADARRGIQVTNAITTTNQMTSIGVEVINPIGNATATDRGTGVSNDVGVISEYPSFATSDHAFATPSVTNGKWRVFGLEPLKTYQIRFWGSQLLSGYRILQVKRTDESVWQEFNAGMNRNYNNAVTFAVSGKTEVSFDFKVKSGSVGGHISIIDIVSTSSNQMPSVNQPPVAFAGIDTSIVLPATLQLRGSGADADGVISSYLWRKISGPAAFQISNVSIAEPVISGLVAGIYQMELTVTDDKGLTDVDTIAVQVKPAVIPVTSQRILIDLGLANTTTAVPDQWGKYWNNVTDARPGIRINNAVNTANQPTAVQFEVIRQTGSAAGYDLNTRTSNSIGTIGDYPASATNDNAFAHTSITDGEWRFSGLDPAKSYTIKFWGSITGSGNRFLQVKASYDIVWKEYNASSNLNFDNGITFAISGRSDVRFNIRVKAGSTFSYINVIDIKADAPLSTAPVAEAGENTEVKLPVDTATLNGSASYDPDGSIAGYRWQKIAGPANYMIIDSLSARATVRNLVEGNYKFALTVTDNDGLTSNDTVTLIVLPATQNLPPVANAGPDLYLTLPANKVTLDGGNSTDADGTIISFNWQKVAGPTGGTLTNNVSRITEANSLIQGSYTFAVTVTDNHGLTDHDTVLVIVSAPANRPPLVSAGPDLAVTYPAGATLSGTASDPDGGNLLFTWTQISGPATASVSQPSSASTAVNNLAIGMYQFKLTVSDNGGLEASDTVVVTVTGPAPVTSQRVLIDAGLAASPTGSPDLSGKYWNNVTDARPGVRIPNAVNTAGQPTGLKFEVVNPAGATAGYDLNTRTSNEVGGVGDYPATATNDNAFVHSSVTNGLWKLSGLNPGSTYTVKFWGSIAMSGTRIVQIKPAHESAWKEFNSSMNRTFSTAATFAITGRSEVSFDIRVKSGSSYGYINVIDIAIESNSTVAANSQQPAVMLSMPSSPDFAVSWLDSLAGVNNSQRSVAVPNPTSGSTTIRINNSYLGALDIQLTDVNGRPLSHWMDDKKGLQYGATIQLGGHPAGTYFVIIKMRAYTEVVKIVKR